MACVITYPPMYSFKSPGTLSIRAMATKKGYAGLSDNSRSTGDEELGWNRRRYQVLSVGVHERKLFTEVSSVAPSVVREAVL
jgi:hypothetical protein